MSLFTCHWQSCFWKTFFCQNVGLHFSTDWTGIISLARWFHHFANLTPSGVQLANAAAMLVWVSITCLHVLCHKIAAWLFSLCHFWLSWHSLRCFCFRCWNTFVVFLPLAVSQCVSYLRYIQTTEVAPFLGTNLSSADLQLSVMLFQQYFLI